MLRAQTYPSLRLRSLMIGCVAQLSASGKLEAFKTSCLSFTGPMSSEARGDDEPCEYQYFAARNFERLLCLRARMGDLGAGVTSDCLGTRLIRNWSSLRFYILQNIRGIRMVGNFPRCEGNYLKRMNITLLHVPVHMSS
jgi:hypothetical protein